MRLMRSQADDLPIAGREIVNLALLDSSVRQAAPESFYGERAAPFNSPNARDTFESSRP